MNGVRSEPYDRKLSDLEADERHELSETIANSLEERLGPLGGSTVEVHAGDEYFRMIGIALRRRGVEIVGPLRGLRIGEQLAWYAEHSGEGPRVPDRGISDQRTVPAAAVEDLRGDSHCVRTFGA